MKKELQEDPFAANAENIMFIQGLVGAADRKADSSNSTGYTPDQLFEKAVTIADSIGWPAHPALMDLADKEHERLMKHEKSAEALKYSRLWLMMDKQRRNGVA